MPFDEHNDDHGGGDGDDDRHDGIGTWAQDMVGFIEFKTGRDDLCPTCAKIAVSNLIVADVMANLCQGPDDVAEFIEDFMNKALQVAEKMKKTSS